MIVVTAQRGGTIRETIAIAKAYAEARQQPRRAHQDGAAAQGRECLVPPQVLHAPAQSCFVGGDGGGAHTLREWFDCTNRDLGLKRILLVLLALTGVQE